MEGELKLFFQKKIKNNAKILDRILIKNMKLLLYNRTTTP